MDILKVGGACRCFLAVSSLAKTKLASDEHFCPGGVVATQDMVDEVWTRELHWIERMNISTVEYNESNFVEPTAPWRTSSKCGAIAG